MGQMGTDAQAMMQQQREAMLAGGNDPSGQLGGMGDPSSASMQQNMGLFSGQNPYASMGLGGGVEALLGGFFTYAAWRLATERV